MIVKNEAHCITKCLESVKSFIDYWVICDTGSSDNTEEVVKNILKDVPGMYVHHDWVDFSTNRNLALSISRKHGDYSFFIDADDYFVCDDLNIFKHLDKPKYSINILQEQVIYLRSALLSNKEDGEYKGVLHESLYTSVESTKLDGCHIVFGNVGHRTKDSDKYKKDAMILQKEVDKDPTNARNVFYCAQSYKDAKMYEEAINMYLKRVNLGGWQEEVYYSFLQIAIICDFLKQDTLTTMNNYLRAFNSLPTRSEALLYLAFYCRKNNLFDHAYFYAKMGIKIPKPSVGLFLDNEVYVWRMYDELASAASYIGKYKEALNISILLMQNTYVPQQEKNRIQANILILEKKVNH